MSLIFLPLIGYSNVNTPTTYWMKILTFYSKSTQLPHGSKGIKVSKDVKKIQNYKQQFVSNKVNHNEGSVFGMPLKMNSTETYLYM